jgi:hypothetical protein
MNERHEGLTPLEREQWLLREQSDLQRARSEARLDDARREQLVREDGELRAQLFAKLPPAQFVQRVQKRASEPRDASVRPQRHAAWALPSLVVALGALALVVLNALPGEQSAAPVERAKGLEIELRVYRKLADGVERLSDGAEVTARDVLQVGYVRGEYAFGVLLSIDGLGVVTLHQPASASETSALTGGPGERLLPAAYELDDAPEFERFIFVAANERIAVGIVEAAARALAKDRQRARVEPLLLPVRTAQRSLLLRKTPVR